MEPARSCDAMEVRRAGATTSSHPPMEGNTMTREDYLEVGRSANGSLLLRTRLLSMIGRLCRIQFKIGGWPYGAHYGAAINQARRRSGAKKDVTMGEGMAVTNGRVGRANPGVAP